jgi:hypothetical protein
LIASGIATAIKSTSRYFWKRPRKRCRTITAPQSDSDTTD